MKFSVETGPAEEEAAELAKFQAQMAAINAEHHAARRQTKLAILELMAQYSIALLSARADGSGDSGSLEEVDCYQDVPGGGVDEAGIPHRVMVEKPEGMELLVDELLETSTVSFDGDGGFWNLEINLAAREVSEEKGWYYTESGSDTTVENL